MASKSPSGQQLRQARNATFRAIDNAIAESPAAKRIPTSGKAGKLAVRKSLTEVLRHVMNGDPECLLDKGAPIVRLAMKIRDDLLREGKPVDWHLLELVWDRFEGAVPAVVESNVTVRGVIALPVLRASEIDWAADAVSSLAAPPPPPPLQLGPAIDVKATSSNQDE